jgi:excisionase family DNA binding protein
MTQPQHTDHDSTEVEGGRAIGPPVGRLAYSVKEAAEATGLSRDLLYDEMRAGRLAYLKIGRRRIITRQKLQAFLAD